MSPDYILWEKGGFGFFFNKLPVWLGLTFRVAQYSEELKNKTKTNPNKKKKHHPELNKTLQHILCSKFQFAWASSHYQMLVTGVVIWVPLQNENVGTVPSLPAPLFTRHQCVGKSNLNPQDVAALFCSSYKTHSLGYALLNIISLHICL